MKKMNFVFHSRVLSGVKLRQGLTILTMLLVFLFGFGFNTVSGQYVGKQEALSRLTQANISIMQSWESLQKSGNTVAIERAGIKQSVLRAMIQDLKMGSSVGDLVKKYVSNQSNSGNVMDFQRKGGKSVDDLAWLNEDILKLLEL
jgi:hypothetical protein